MRIAICLLILACLAGCSAKDKVPSDIIPRDRMSSILWDMVQAEQYSDAYLVKDSAHIDVKVGTLRLYQQVFQLHKVSLDEFRKSLHFYLDHPDMSRGLFDTALNQGNRQREANFRNQKIVPVPPSHGQGVAVPPIRTFPGTHLPPGIHQPPGTHRPPLTHPGSGIPVIVPDLPARGAGKPRPKSPPALR
jgi:hypothetical protein